MTALVQPYSVVQVISNGLQQANTTALRDPVHIHSFCWSEFSGLAEFLAITCAQVGAILNECRPRLSKAEHVAGCFRHWASKVRTVDQQGDANSRCLACQD